nr:MAG TPA: hypothetical protein [Caudoviricetes sp.]
MFIVVNLLQKQNIYIIFVVRKTNIGYLFAINN